MTELEQAVTTVVERCLRVQPGETVLVVADPASTAIGEALVAAARAAGGDAVLTILPPDAGRGTEPPAPVAAALAAADVFLAPCLPSLSHTSARKRASHVTCPRGIDIQLDLRGRDGIPDAGDLSAAGAFGNLPCGEGPPRPPVATARSRPPRWTVSASPRNPCC